MTATTSAPTVVEYRLGALNGANPIGFLTALGLLSVCDPGATLHFDELEPVLRMSSSASQVASHLRAVTDKTTPGHDLKGADRLNIAQTPQVGAWVEFQERTWGRGRQVASWTRLVDPAKPAPASINVEVTEPKKKNGSEQTIEITVPAGKRTAGKFKARRFTPDDAHPWVDFAADGTLVVDAPPAWGVTLIEGILTDVTGGNSVRGRLRIQVKQDRKLSGSRLWFRKAGEFSGPVPTMVLAWGDDPGAKAPAIPRACVMNDELVLDAVTVLLRGESPVVLYGSDPLFRYISSESPLPVNELLLAAATRCLPPADADRRTRSLSWSLWTTPLNVTSAVEVLRRPDLAASAGLRRFSAVIAPTGESMKTTCFISTQEEK